MAASSIHVPIQLGLQLGPIMPRGQLKPLIIRGAFFLNLNRGSLSLTHNSPHTSRRLVRADLNSLSISLPLFLSLSLSLLSLSHTQQPAHLAALGARRLELLVHRQRRHARAHVAEHARHAIQHREVGQQRDHLGWKEEKRNPPIRWPSTPAAGVARCPRSPPP
jgi:hypothetical protein